MSKKNLKTKFIFVVGGVMSGVGKGITTASIAQILSSKGYNVSAMKIDPYINVDAGTMNPMEHGEVFVTEDGDETDQDVGNYERFLNKNIYKENYMTTGRVYQSVIEKERSLKYEGKCVQVIPHIPMEIRDRIKKASKKTEAEIMVIEVGGTVGEYENLLFLEAARVMKLKNPEDVIFVMVSYLPMPNKIGEMKTKPTQHAVRSLNTAGIQPNFIVARSEKGIDKIRRNKIAIHCNISKDDVISAPDLDSIYEIPISFEDNNIGSKILKKLNLRARNNPKAKADNQKWKEMVNNIKDSKKEVKIAIIGKYFNIGDFSFTDSYISLIEAIKHASASRRVKPKLEWIGDEDIKKEGVKIFKKFDGVIIPQGWGNGKPKYRIEAIEHCRENNVPYLGICHGMQMAVVEFAQNVCNLKEADKIICEKETRLGSWPCKLKKGTKIAKAYGKSIINERHRHQQEVNNEYRQILEEKGLVVSGMSPDDKIIESIEIKNHPFFVGVQFNPEYISRPLDPHPLFLEFIKSLIKK